MKRTRELGTVFAISAVFLFLIACAANIYLTRYRTHQKHSQSIARGVQPGTYINRISGVDFEGKPLIVNPRSSQALVLLVYSPRCSFCDQNWPAWRHTLSEFSGKGAKFVSVDLSGEATSVWLHSRDMSTLTAFHLVDKTTFAKLKLGVTPETILIGRDGSVKDIWVGVLDSEDSAQLSKEMRDEVR